MCLNNGTSINIYLPFGTDEKLMVLGVSVLRHIRVCHKTVDELQTLQSLIKLVFVEFL